MTHVNILMVGRIVSETQTDRQTVQIYNRYKVELNCEVYLWHRGSRAHSYITFMLQTL